MREDENARGKVRVVIELKKMLIKKEFLINCIIEAGLSRTSFPLCPGWSIQLRSWAWDLGGVCASRCYSTWTEFEPRKSKERAHILEGLKIALDHIDGWLRQFARVMTMPTSVWWSDLVCRKLSGLNFGDAATTITGLERDRIEEEGEATPRSDPRSGGRWLTEANFACR